MRVALSGGMVALLALLGPAMAWSASEFPDPYGCTTVQGRCKGSDARYPVQYVSLYDGTKDYYFVRFPDGYDKQKAYPLLIHFHPYCAGLSAIADPRMLRQVANDDQVIFLGHWQRGGAEGVCGASYLGDGKAESSEAARAAREDMRELVNELAARFKISYIIAAGASMGGYDALRMPTLFPDKVYVVMTSAAALFKHHNIFPEPTTILNAARDGAYDGRLVFSVEGSMDFSIAAHRQLNSILQGNKYWRYHEVQSAGHISVYSDDWNVAHGYCKDPNSPTSHCWYISSPDAPGLWQAVRAWAGDHPEIANSLLEPDCGWQQPAQESAHYLTAVLEMQGGRSWPRAIPACAKGAPDAGGKSPP